ncbi:unnamed protein product [Moneuplotes crassus]|uniref:Transmembrane protein n=1 Tax=Euplotes crassus TaxID=5936 RepID=A0AAD1Y153_EUPCR|nr:unnamed protein product [Moneuplotes crassus]
MPGEEDQNVNANQPQDNAGKNDKDKKNQQKKPKPLDKPRSSLALQILLYFDYFFSIFYGIVTLVLLIYKSFELIYPSSVFELEVTFLILFWIWQLIKIFLGSKGNKTETNLTTLFFVILTIPSIFGFCFYMLLQTYVLVIEIILNAIGIFFCVLELIIGFVQFFIFRKIEKSD